MVRTAKVPAQTRTKRAAAGTTPADRCARSTPGRAGTGAARSSPRPRPAGRSGTAPASSRSSWHHRHAASVHVAGDDGGLRSGWGGVPSAAGASYSNASNTAAFGRRSVPAGCGSLPAAQGYGYTSVATHGHRGRLGALMRCVAVLMHSSA